MSSRFPVEQWYFPTRAFAEPWTDYLDAPFTQFMLEKSDIIRAVFDHQRCEQVAALKVKTITPPRGADALSVPVTPAFAESAMRAAPALRWYNTTMQSLYEVYLLGHEKALARVTKANISDEDYIVWQNNSNYEWADVFHANAAIVITTYVLAARRFIDFTAFHSERITLGPTFYDNGQVQLTSFFGDRMYGLDTTNAPLGPTLTALATIVNNPGPTALTPTDPRPRGMDAQDYHHALELAYMRGQLRHGMMFPLIWATEAINASPRIFSKEHYLEGMRIDQHVAWLLEQFSPREQWLALAPMIRFMQNKSIIDQLDDADEAFITLEALRALHP